MQLHNHVPEHNWPSTSLYTPGSSIPEVLKNNHLDHISLEASGIEK